MPCVAAGFRVCLIDPDPLAVWPNNYGVWVDEFAAMGLDDCLEVIWQQATVFLDQSATGQRYARVTRGLGTHAYTKLAVHREL